VWATQHSPETQRPEYFYKACHGRSVRGVGKKKGPIGERLGSKKTTKTCGAFIPELHDRENATSGLGMKALREEALTVLSSARPTKKKKNYSWGRVLEDIGGRGGGALPEKQSGAVPGSFPRGPGKSADPGERTW